MTSEMKTHCVGRYLIDMPSGITPIGTAKFDEISVESKAMTFDDFEQESEDREGKIKAIKSSLGYRFLYDYGEVPNVDKTQYFVSLGDYASSSDAKRVIEAYKWDQGYQLTVKITAFDFIHSKMRDAPSVKDMETPNDLPEKTHAVFNLIARLQGRAEDVVPTEPGACFYGGFLEGKTSTEEYINSAFVISAKPDAWFNLESFTDLHSNDTLLQRVHGREMNEVFKAADGALIRSGTIALAGGMKADEALMSGRTPTNSAVQGNLLSLEANYSGGRTTPYLLLDMKNGYPSELINSWDIKQASLTEGEAIGIWDKVSRSLRARPDGF